MTAGPPHGGVPRARLRQRPRRQGTRQAKGNPPVPRERINLTLSSTEKAEVSATARARGQAPTAFALEAVLSAARHTNSVPAALRLELQLLMNLAGLVRRAGLVLREATSNPERTVGQQATVSAAAEECMRIVRRVDETAETIRRRIP